DGEHAEDPTDVDERLEGDPGGDSGGQHLAEEVGRKMLMSAWKEIQAVIPVASILPKRSGAREATAHPATARAMNRPITVMAPISPVSSPMMAKMKSVWALGR